MKDSNSKFTLDDLIYNQDDDPAQVLKSFYTLMRDKKNTIKALGDILNNPNADSHHQFAKEALVDAVSIMEKMLEKVATYLKQSN